MVLLAQLFRHKSVPPGEHSTAHQPGAPEGPGDVRGLGAIAAAVGVRRQDGMPEEFVLSLGELMARVPEKFMWLGKHDESRMVRIAAADIAPVLARGRAEISLARLVALAPDVFRWERGETDDPQIRLPIQKLLQQIGDYAASQPEKSAEQMPMPEIRGSHPAMPEAAEPAEIIASHLPSIRWDGTHVANQTASVPSVDLISSPERLAPVEEEIGILVEMKPPPETEATAPVVKLEPRPLPEAAPVISVAASEPASRPVELRPQKDAATSTTLRAVVLGGSGPAGTASASAPTLTILAPRGAAVVGGAPPPVFLAPPVAGPSVVPSPHGDALPRVHGTEPDFAALQNLFMKATPLDLAGVAALVAALPGMRACQISGAAGTTTGGEFPADLSMEEVRGASEEIAHRGGVRDEIVHRGESDIALFLHDSVCVAAVMAGGGFVPGVRERLVLVAELLAGAGPSR